MDTLLNIGQNYEIYTRDFIKTKYQECWIWKDIPKPILLELGFITSLADSCDDIGCDILAKKSDNTYDYIQCKNYSTLGIDNTISICDLAGFYNFVSENNISNPIVYYSGILSSQILTRRKRIKYIHLPYLKIKDENIKPREYQLQAYNILENANRGILDMPCGTGKTLITYMISLKYDNIILLSPLISTTEQLIIHYKKYYSTKEDIPTFNIINSQHTRKIDRLILSNKNIIGATFDSCDVINNLIKKLSGSVFVVIDECHNLSPAMLGDVNNEVYKLLHTDMKFLFVSATPKYYDSSYDDIFGNTRFQLNWKESIENNYICKTDFYYPNNDKIITRIDELKIDKKLIEKTILINKSYFLCLMSYILQLF